MVPPVLEPLYEIFDHRAHVVEHCSSGFGQVDLVVRHSIWDSECDVVPLQRGPFVFNVRVDGP